MAACSGKQSLFPPFLSDVRGLKPVQEDTPQLMRTRSDVGVRRRGNVRTSSDQRRIRRHRFSINGHFYNHKVEKVEGEEDSFRGATPLPRHLSPRARAMWSLVGPWKTVLLSFWVMGRLQAVLAVRGLTDLRSEVPPRMGEFREAAQSSPCCTLKALKTSHEYSLPPHPGESAWYPLPDPGPFSRCIV
jgi:hypothetical protein